MEKEKGEERGIEKQKKGKGNNWGNGKKERWE